jgi:hypothetical protein
MILLKRTSGSSSAVNALKADYLVCSSYLHVKCNATAIACTWLGPCRGATPLRLGCTGGAAFDLCRLLCRCAFVWLPCAAAFHFRPLFRSTYRGIPVFRPAVLPSSPGGAPLCSRFTYSAVLDRNVAASLSPISAHPGRAPLRTVHSFKLQSSFQHSAPPS